MSAEGATALYERVTSDEAFRTKLEGAETPEDKRRMVTDAGYDVSRSDLPTIMKLGGVTDLSDEDMEKVAGGVGIGSFPMPPGFPAGGDVAVAALWT